MSEGDILVLPEIRKGELDSTTFRLLAEGRKLADKLGVGLVALIVGHSTDSLVQSLNHSGADTILVLDHPTLANYNAEKYFHVISGVMGELRPSFLLLGYTYWGMELGPALAQRSGSYMVSNCIDVEVNGSILRAVRPMFAGGYHVKVELQGQRSYVLSFQKGAVAAPTGNAVSSRVMQGKVAIEEVLFRSKVLELLEPPAGEVDITKAEILVSVGRGVGDKANIPVIKELADALGGSLACSRPVADLGWLPKEYHVGISGKTVTPKVYVACAISGSSQHLAGMEGSSMIIAINKDAKAPIFRVAHYGAVGDIFEIVPEMTRQARASRKLESG